LGGTQRGLLGAVAVLHAFLVPIAGIRWDEFRFLEDVHSFRRGTLSSVFQTFHVHLFRWLPAVGGNEVDQVIAARSAYYVLLLGSCGLVYLIGKRFLSSAASLFVVLCYLTFNEVVVHATTFRFDGLSVFLLLAATATLLYGERSDNSVVLAGGLTAIALLITAKSIFYLPTLCIIALLRRASVPWAARARDLALFGGSALALFVLALALHRHALAAGSLAASTGALQHAGDRVLALDVLFPARPYIVQAVIFNPVVWFFLLVGAVSLLRLVAEHLPFTGRP
jgi:4-amino-4-deoxy-L-arabinose transferase-like glycosyltransferase